MVKMKDLPAQRNYPAGTILRESGVPIPPRGRRLMSIKKIYEEVQDMEIGGSILIASEEINQGLTAVLAKKFGGRFMRRAYKTGPERGYTRIWRIE